MTYKCDNCGKPHLTKEAAHLCCGGKEKCPKCGGSGVIVGFLGPNQPCPACKGTGLV